MTPERYYRRAMWAPVAVPLLAAAIVALAIVIVPRPTRTIASLMDVANFLAAAGLVSLIPYGVFAGVIRSHDGNRTEADYRLLTWLAPSYIAFPFAVCMRLVAWPIVGSRGAFTFAWYLGLVALATGYFYSVLISGVLMLLKRFGRVDRFRQ